MVDSGEFSEALYVEYSLPMAGVLSNKLFSGALFLTGKSGFLGKDWSLIRLETGVEAIFVEYLNISFKSALIRIR
ncbi:hypothetical protein D3C72_2321110 [compost metagenome]